MRAAKGNMPKLAVSENPVMDKGPADEGPNDYETQGHLRTLTDAHMIQQDPAKMERVRALSDMHRNVIKSTKRLRGILQEKYGKPAGGSAPEFASSVVAQKPKMASPVATSVVAPKGKGNKAVASSVVASKAKGM